LWQKGHSERKNKMSNDAETIYHAAMQLPEQQRAHLAGLLINSLETEPDSAWEVAWSAEIERRVAEFDRGEAVTISWADLRRKLWEGLDESDSANPYGSG
jgi:putative addiction module component (TIGR02574 family)